MLKNVKQNKLNKSEICNKWLANKNINPETSRKIKETGAIYKKLFKECSIKPLNNDKNDKKDKNDKCNKWLVNKNINPETSRAIKETGAIYKKLLKECSIKPLNKTLNKTDAANKIKRLFNPYIKRITANISDRIGYYMIIRRYLKSIKENNNCVKLYNIDEKNEQIYRVGRNIILDKQIGSNSLYGVVFLSHYKTNVKYGNRFDKLNKFAVKITNKSNKNAKEIKMLEYLTVQVRQGKCPHFPILYGYLECNEPMLKSNISNDYSIIKDKKNKFFNINEFISNDTKLYIQINELASGDLTNILPSDEERDVLNITTQTLISIMFFHNMTNSLHTDTHTGNFLYHKIKPGGYFHYNIYGKDYYLENEGYLWVIWDFGEIEPFSSKNKIIIDYQILLRQLYNNNYIDIQSSTIIQKLFIDIVLKYKDIYDIKLLKQLDIDILDFLLKNVSSFTTKKPLNIINPNPYIIS
jgi:hypothetical protein